ncbi:MAG: hypothetical protein B7Y99_13235 [Caulobacterales bacterium 32-69-10]|nr:MAG: hypothetical protein B7Y99_13235 [Caulobacterales bacterium 32-69-10]
MKIKPWAKCTSSLPTDEIETEDGRDFVQYGGKSVAKAIAEDLSAFGCAVEAPQHAHEHGWECSFKFQGRSLWFQVTLIDDYYLVFEDVTFWASKSRPHAAYVEFMRRVGPALRQDIRLENLRWYVEPDDGSEGAQEPVTE